MNLQPILDNEEILRRMENERDPEFEAVQAARRKEKLAAAKQAVDEALYDLSSSQSGRDSEATADAIENLIRVIMENA